MIDSFIKAIQKICILIRCAGVIKSKYFRRMKMDLFMLHCCASLSCFSRMLKILLTAMCQLNYFRLETVLIDFGSYLFWMNTNQLITIYNRLIWMKVHRSVFSFSPIRWTRRGQSFEFLIKSFFEQVRVVCVFVFVQSFLHAILLPYTRNVDTVVSSSEAAADRRVSNSTIFLTIIQADTLRSFTKANSLNCSCWMFLTVKNT